MKHSNDSALAPGVDISPAAWTRGPRGLSTFVKPPSISDAGAHGQVLIIVNDAELGAVLLYCLTAAGFRARVSARDADRAEEMRREVPDVVLLDSRLSGGRSIDVWRQIRTASGDERPPAVIMFIADETDIDPRLSLEFGPCDFVVYPFSVRDLVLRIDSIIRLPGKWRVPRIPAGPGVAAAIWSVASRSTLTGRSCRSTASGRAQPDRAACSDLSDQEPRSRLLARRLARRRVGIPARVMNRAADVHITRLRTKLALAGNVIETIRGAGYRLSAEHPVIVSE